MSSKTVLGSGKNILIDVLHQMESTLKVTEVLTCKNKYSFFINKFQVLGGLPLYTYPRDSSKNLLLCHPLSRGYALD